MFGNHRWRLDVSCPSCGTSGAIRVVEDGGPPFRDAPRREYSDPEGRFAVLDGDPPEIQCQACARRFPSPG